MHSRLHIEKLYSFPIPGFPFTFSALHAILTETEPEGDLHNGKKAVRNDA